MTAEDIEVDGKVSTAPICAVENENTLTFTPSVGMESFLIPTFHQISWNNLIVRVDHGTQALLELQTLFQDRKENDERQLMHYMKMSKANLFQYEIETSTSERMLGFFKNYHLFVHKALIHHHKEFVESILKDLEILKEERTWIINKHKVNVQTCLKDIATAQDGLEKAKRSFLKSKTDFERSSERLSQAERALEESIRLSEEKKKEISAKESTKWSRMFSAFESTPEQEREKQLKKVDKRRDELSNAADAIVERRQLLLNVLARYDQEIMEATDAFQKIEIDRMEKVQSLMKRFCELEKKALEARQQQLLIYEESITLQQPEEDIALFITQGRQPELVHKFSSALTLLEEFNTLRIDENEQNVLDISEGDYQSTSHEGIIKKDPSLNSNIDKSVVIATENAASPSVAPEEGPVLTSRETIVDPNLEKLNGWFSDIFNMAIRPSDKLCKINIEEGILSEDPNFVNPIMVHDVPEWREALSSKLLRNRFMQELDHKRSKYSQLDHSRYETLANGMVAFLDICEESEDMMVAVSAMRVANMANTFHKRSDGSTSNKTYLQSEPRFLQHSIWKKAGFWELALKESVFAQMHNHFAVTRWDELNMDQLREVVQGIHNILFGQLGTLSFAMLQQGLSQQEVVDHVIRMSRKFELNEDQEYELIVNATGKRIKEYVPPPILAVPSLPAGGTPSPQSESKVFAVPTGQEKKSFVFSRSRKPTSDIAKPTIVVASHVTQPTNVSNSTTTANPDSEQPTVHTILAEPKKSKMSFLSSMTRSSSTSATPASHQVFGSASKAIPGPIGNNQKNNQKNLMVPHHQTHSVNSKDLDDDFFAVL